MPKILELEPHISNNQWIVIERPDANGNLVEVFRSKRPIVLLGTTRTSAVIEKNGVILRKIPLDVSKGIDSSPKIVLP